MTKNTCDGNPNQSLAYTPDGFRQSGHYGYACMAGECQLIVRDFAGYPHKYVGHMTIIK